MSVVYGKCRGCGARGGVNKEPGHKVDCAYRLEERRKIDALGAVVDMLWDDDGEPAEDIVELLPAIRSRLSTFAPGGE